MSLYFPDNTFKGSYNFGLDNNLRQSVAKIEADIHWCYSLAPGAGSSVSGSSLAFLCRIPREHLGTSSYESDVTTLFTFGPNPLSLVITAGNPVTLTAKYYGPHANEIAFRNRICFFGNDSVNPLGSVTATGATLAADTSAVRSPEILDSQPRLVCLELRNLVTNTYEVNVTLVSPGSQLVQVGDTLVTSFGAATPSLALGMDFRALYIGGPPSPTTNVSDYFCGEFGRIALFEGRLTRPSFAPLTHYDGLAAGIDAYWNGTTSVQLGQPYLYRTLDTTPAGLLPASTADTYPSVTFSGNGSPIDSGSSLCGSSYPAAHPNCYVTVDKQVNGRVYVGPGGTLAINGWSRQCTAPGFAGPALLRVELWDQQFQMVRATASSLFGAVGAAFFDIPTRWNSFFTNLQPGWYCPVVTAYPPNNPGGVGSRNVDTASIGAGERIWVLGDAVLQQMADPPKTVSFTGQVGALSLAERTENVTATVAERRLPGLYRSPRTITSSDLRQGRLQAMRTFLGNYAVTSSTPTEFVFLTPIGSTLSDWTTDAATESQMHLLSEYGLLFSQYYSFGTSWVLSHGTLAGVVAETVPQHLGWLNQLFTQATGNSLCSLVNNAILPVTVLPAYRQSPLGPAETRIATMRTALRQWAAAAGSPVRRLGGVSFNYPAKYSVTAGTAMPDVATGGWLAAASSVAYALRAATSGSPATFSAVFRDATRAVIDVTCSMPIVVNNSAPFTGARFDVSDNGGGFYTSSGYTVIQQSSTQFVITKATGTWAGVADGQLWFRYGYGYPFFRADPGGSMTAAQAEAFYFTADGVLRSADFNGFYEQPETILVVQPNAVQPTIAVRLLAILGAGT